MRMLSEKGHSWGGSVYSIYVFLEILKTTIQSLLSISILKCLTQLVGSFFWTEFYFGIRLKQNAFVSESIFHDIHFSIIPRHVARHLPNPLWHLVYKLNKCYKGILRQLFHWSSYYCNSIFAFIISKQFRTKTSFATWAKQFSCNTISYAAYNQIYMPGFSNELYSWLNPYGKGACYFSIN